MPSVYLDNASTSFPKPACVPEAVYRYMTACGSNVSRGGYQAAYSAEELVFETRERVCALFHGEDARCVVFTPNITTSLNILLKGFLHPGDHVLVSSMEHNAVMRPLRQLEVTGVRFDRIPCRTDGTLVLDAMEGLVRENTKLVLCLHASNVCGTLLPIDAIGAFCHRHGLRFFLDSAQTAGVFPIDMQQSYPVSTVAWGVCYTNTAYSVKTIRNVEVSTDGVNWTPQNAGDVTIAQATGDNGVMQWFTFVKPVEARLIRFDIVDRYDTGSNFCGMRELEVWSPKN